MAFKPAKFVKLYATKVDMNWVVSGYDTFTLKDYIKSFGGKWQPKTKSWHLDDVLALQSIVNSLSEERHAQKVFEKSPEGHQAAIKALKEKDAQTFANALALKAQGDHTYHWICCDQCKVVDWSRQHTTCDVHAEDNGYFKNSFRVRGRLYTGD
jgi:hypothetical protein